MSIIQAPAPHLLKKPKALKPGDTIAVISTSSPTSPPDSAFAEGLAWIETNGFTPKLMPNAKAQWHYLAGTDAERLSDLHAAFADPSVDGILCARGGYGTMRLLPHIDFSIIQNNPKVLIGFSDLTALHLAFYQQTGLVGFYGPMLISNLTDPKPTEEQVYEQAALLNLVCDKQPTPITLINQNAYHCLQTGLAEAPLTGGNLSLLAALCGTPWQPKTDGHLLFIEDWKEKHYSLDRKFQQLKLAGVLNNIAGLLLCDFSEIEPEPDQSLIELFTELTSDLQQRGIPVGYGFSVGHGSQSGTLPYGISARFDAAQGTLTLLEKPVVQASL